jgi:hypothetical protein
MEFPVAENTEPTGTEQPEDEAVLDLQNLENTDEGPEVEAHESISSILSISACNWNT